MNIEEKITWLERELKEIKKEVEEKKIQEAEKLKPWKPVCCDLYYSIVNDGEVFEDNWGSAKYDMACFAIGNCFKTREEAEFMVERLKVIQELKQFARPYRGSETNYCICFNHRQNKVEICPAMTFQQSGLYFKSGKIAKQAIEAVGADRVKKYYLQVKED